MNLLKDQKKSKEKLSTMKVGAFFMGAGTGKTRPLVELVHEIQPDYVLYFAPYRCINTCGKEESTLFEINKWGGFNCDFDLVGIETIQNSASVYLKYWKKITASKKGVIVVDESIKIKNANALRTKRITELGKFSQYRYILNGTPLSRNLLDLKSQIDFLSPSILNMSDAEFKNTFCEYKRMTIRKPNTYKSRSNEYIPDVITGKSRFYLLEKSHIIAYNPYGRIISPKAFCQTFVGVLMLSDDSLKIEAEIHPVNDEYEFINFINKMTTISNISLNLVPSNPNPRDIWKEMDDRLNDINAKSYSEKIEAKPNKSLIIDELTQSKIAMAQDGYGKVVAKGTDENGDSVEISTERKESVIKKEIFKNLAESDQLKALKRVFVKILERFKR